VRVPGCPASAGSAPGRQLEATIQVLEPMGSDTYLSLEMGFEDEWIARVDASYTPNERTSVQATFDDDALDLFDADETTIESQETGAEPFHGRVSPSH
jgi:multiple sugar transport system ATP-binding protein